MSTRRPTITDVARRAGVSPSTASVVFSGKTAVSDATRQRVLDAAGALGYTGPDPRAASLRRGRSGIVGVVFEEHLGAAFLDPVKTLMMDGLTDGVASLGAGLLLLRDHAPLGTEPTLTTAPLDAAVLIGCSGMLRESLAVVTARGIPVVVIEGDAGEGIPKIGLDNREAQRQAASHLKVLGHAEVAIVTLPVRAGWERGWITADEPITVDVTRERLAGAREVFPDAALYAAAGSFIDEGFAAGRAIFADPAATTHGRHRAERPARGGRDPRGGRGRTARARRRERDRLRRRRRRRTRAVRADHPRAAGGREGPRGRAGRRGDARRRDRGIHPLHLRVPRGQHHRTAGLSRFAFRPDGRRRIDRADRLDATPRSPEPPPVAP